MKNSNVMLDLETMDTAATAAIISIGAVRFTEDSVVDEFYATIDLESSIACGGTLSGSTIKWWMQQPNKSEAFKDADSLPSALLLLSNWLPENVRIWGNGSDFDNVILANAYKNCGLIRPWIYYNNMCYRTMKNLAPNIKMERDGQHHNALDDARSQAKHLIRICNHLGVQL